MELVHDSAQHSTTYFTGQVNHSIPLSRVNKNLTAIICGANFITSCP